MKLTERIYLPNWHDTYKWQVPIKLFLDFEVPNGWKKVLLKDILTQVVEKEKVILDKSYKLAGVKWYGEGLFYRETQKGEDLSASWLTPLVQDAFIYNRLFAWKESFAIVTSDFVGHYVSSEFPQFIVDKEVILPKYLQLFFLQPNVIKAVNKASAGSAAVSRNRFKEDDFLEFEVLVPSLTDQSKIVEVYENEIKAIEDSKAVIELIEDEMDSIFLNELNVQIVEEATDRNIFYISFNEIERWDTFFFNEKFRLVNKRLKEINSKTLGDCVQFVKRGWTATDFPEGKFRYVQIGDVSGKDGISYAKDIVIHEAPSRAQQVIKEGDIIISTTRPYLGAFALVPSEFDNCVASSGFSVIEHVNPEFDKEFILYFLKSKLGLLQFEQRMTGGLYPAITQDQLERILIPGLAMEKQIEIVNKINSKRSDIKEISDERLGKRALINTNFTQLLFPTKKQ